MTINTYINIYIYHNHMNKYKQCVYEKKYIYTHIQCVCI